MELTILMPCLNEALTLGRCIEKAKKFLCDENIQGEVLIADNGSTDGSLEIAEKLGARVVHISEKGYGAALRGGIESACGKYVIMGDSDDTYDFSKLHAFVEKLREGYDMVVGNRFKGGIEPGAMPFLHKYLGNPVISFLAGTFFSNKVGDYYCGLRGFNTEKIRKLNLKAKGMEYANEQIIKAYLFQLSITEVPTTLSQDPPEREPHLRTWRDGWRTLRFLLTMSPAWCFINPGLLLIATGLFLTGATYADLTIVPNVHFGAQALLTGIATMLIGTQALAFGTYIRKLASIKGWMPPNRKLEQFFQSFTLEKGLIASGIGLSIGIVLFILSTYTWAINGFGPLDNTVTMKTFIPAIGFILLAVQMGFTSFVLSILKDQEQL